MDESFEHIPVVPPRRVTNVPRLDRSFLDRFASVPTPDIADQVGLHYTMDPGIHGLFEPMDRLVGQALTVKPWPGDGLAVFGATGLAQDGDVLVIDGRGQLEISRSGFHMLQVPRKRGLRGLIIDGAVRDAEEFREVGFPIFGRSRTPHASSKRRAGEINVPVACGGVIVEPGDLVVADTEGIAVVPRRHVARVWEAVTGEPPMAKTDDELEAQSAKRWEAYDRAFAAAGGETLEWDEGVGAIGD